MKPYYADESVTLWHGDALEVMQGLPDGSVDCCVTSPPYFGLRDYGVEGQYGLEASPAEYVATMAALFAEVRRVLADDGTLWLNIGDSYSTNLGQGDVGGNLQGGTHNSYRRDGLAVSPLRRRRLTGGVPSKNLFGIPWRTAFALQDEGWVLRNSIIWHKPNGKPESATDRLTGRHELVFLLTKSQRYWFDLTAINGGGSNPGDVWTIPTQPCPEAHFAVMPSALADRCILAGCKPGGTILDPFSGSGTTGLAAARNGRRYVGVDLNAEYLDLSLRTRLAQSALIEGAS